MGKYHDIKLKIMQDYKGEFSLNLTKKETVPYCNLDIKRVTFNIEDYFDNKRLHIFDLLHEIGHIKTNLPGMKRYEEEFYATQWAADRLKEYDGSISKKEKELYQDYLYRWRERSIACGGKNVMSKESIKIKW